MEVLGIGSPVVDLIIHVEEHFKIPGHRGSSTPITWEAFVQLLKEAGPPRIRTGGSCSNTLKGLASLGVQTSLFGKVGVDPMGKYFLETILDLQITPLLIQSDTPTTQVICLIPPDKNRTMFFYPGAGAELTEHDLSDQLFKARHLHIEGHLLSNGRLVEESMRRAKAHGATISFDLGSYDLAYNHKERIMHLLPDILFANQEEARAMTGSTGEEACQKLLPYGKTIVILMGAEGCVVGSQEGIIRGRNGQGRRHGHNGRGGSICERLSLWLFEE